MHRNRKASGRVAGHFEKLIAGEVYIRVVTGNQQVALCVVAAGRSHGINERLIYPVHKVVGGLLFSAVCSAVPVPETFPAERLILGFKHQLVATIPEQFGYLLPHSGVAFHVFVNVLRELADPAVVVVNVDYNVHSSA